MGKISPVSVKYNILADLKLSGVADRPDVIGAIFGQTEGLLGSELELRELQKSGKIGRINVKIRSKRGKSEGKITIPSSIGKSETAIIAAAIETIDRVGPCNAKIKVKDIQDVRVTKRDFILKRAEELLKSLVRTLPDSAEFTNKVTRTVRTMEVMEYGKDKLPAGPKVDGSDEVIIVEGRADVVNLLKYGIRNVVAVNGKKSTGTLKGIIHKKIVTLFVDGDRGGDLVVKKLSQLSDIDFVTQAPDGKEVEELTIKEIQKALRAKQNWEQYSSELSKKKKSRKKRRSKSRRSSSSRRSRRSRSKRSSGKSKSGKKDFVKKHGKTLKELSEDLIGTRGAYVLDDGLNILGKVPVKELSETLNEITDPVFSVVMDGSIGTKLAKTIDKKKVKYVVAKSAKNKTATKASVITTKEL